MGEWVGGGVGGQWVRVCVWQGQIGGGWAVAAACVAGGGAATAAGVALDSCHIS